MRIPKERVFFDLFAEAGSNIRRVGELLERLLREWRTSTACGASSSSAKQEGDRITHDIIHRLNATSVTPIDREDIYALAGALDDVLVGFRLRLFKLADELGNVSAACRAMGVDSTY